MRRGSEIEGLTLQSVKLPLIPQVDFVRLRLSLMSWVSLQFTGGGREGGGGLGGFGLLPFESESRRALPL